MSKNKYKAKHDEELRLKQEKAAAEEAAAQAAEESAAQAAAHEEHDAACCGHDHAHEHHHEEHDDDCCCHDHEHEHHHEEHDDDCCCGHDHEHEHHHEEHHDNCCCHDHEHEHHHEEHDDDCCCGHDHEHEHHHEDHDDDCCCGHDHEHEHEHHHEHHHEHAGHAHHEAGEACQDPSHPEGCLVREHDYAPGDRRVFILEGLDCPNCAQKIENAISQLPTVDNVVVTYANLQMRVKASENRGLLRLLQRTVDSVEDGVTVVERSRENAGSTTCVYLLQGLDCPNCAQKIENHLNSLPQIDEAVVTYANTQVRITARGAESLTELLQKEVDSVEDGITVVLRSSAPQSDAQTPAADPMKRSLCEILAGAAVFALAFICSHAGLAPEGPSWVSILFVVSYLILGYKVLKTAAANVVKGQMFDENFLMAVATLGAFGLGLYSGSWEFDEAVGVMLFYRIGEYFEQKATAQSRSQIMDAVDMRPETVNLVSGDSVQTLAASAAKVGDLVLVRPGDRIPLDGTVIEGESRIDTSPVTGEPVPVKAVPGDAVISGCVNTGSLLKVRVDKVLEESMVTKILDSVENAAASKPKIDRFITRFSRIYTPAVVLLAIAVAVIPSVLGACFGLKLPFILARLAEDTNAAYAEYWITTALTFLVISCPCALVLSIPLAFFSGIGAASGKGILFKGGIAIESLTGVKAVVMDKTGTITKGNFALQSVVPAPGSGITEEQLLSLAASCELSSTHPIGTGILAAAREKGLDIHRPEIMEEIAGKGIRAVVDGVTVLTGNRKLLAQYGIDADGLSAGGCGTEVLVAIDGKPAGSLLISDTIKEGAAEAAARLKAQGITTAMLTGDAQESARAVAEKVGIDEVHAKLMPQDKLTHLAQIRQKHGAVMFVGDGINDAPVLAGADVGAAMGTGADAAIEAADVVFMTSEMSAIPQAIDIAKATSRVSWQNVYFALAVKFLVMLLGLLGFANMWLAVFADTGVSMLCLLNSFRILKTK